MTKHHPVVEAGLRAYKAETDPQRRQAILDVTAQLTLETTRDLIEAEPLSTNDALHRRHIR
jgi:hypothetical protein